MAQVSSRERVLEETTLVDVDVHLTTQMGVVSAEDMAPYIDDERDLRRLAAEHAFPQSYGADHVYGGSDRIDNEPRMLTDPAKVQEHVCDQLHVDYPLLNTNPGIHKLPDGELAARLMRAFNDYLVEHFLETSDFFGLAAIAQQDPEAAAAEIHRMGDIGQIVGIYMGSTGPKLPLGHPRFDPIYASAEDEGLHIAYHGAAADKFRYDFPKQHHGVQTFIELNSLAHPWSQSLTLTSLLANGVPERYPDINFTFLEAGLTWVPHFLWQLNREYERKADEFDGLDRAPEAVARESFYYSSQPLGEPERLGQMQDIIDVVGTESVMFASDYPHFDFDHPQELDKHLRSVFSKAEREQVLWKTPAEAFDLPI